MERVLLLDTPHLTAVAQDFGTPTVFVTFNEMGMRASGTSFWGDGFFAKCRISSIGIVSKYPNWYPAEDARQAVAAARAAIAGRRVVTYGYSQGAYGALKYGAALGASVSLAFSPQWSIDPEDVGKVDRRYTSYFNEDLRNGLRIEAGELARQNYLFFDPNPQLERFNAEKIENLGVVQRVMCPFVGHFTIRQVVEGRIATSLIQAASDSDIIPLSLLRRLLRQARSQSMTYLSGAISQLSVAGRRRQATMAGLVLMMPENRRGVVSLQIEIAIGRSDRAAAILDGIADSELARELEALWTIFRKHRFLAGELRIAPLWKAVFPRNAFLRLHAVNSLIEAGKTAGAIAELHDIMDSCDIASAADMVIDFALRLQDKIGLEKLLTRLILSRSLAHSRRADLGFRIIDKLINWGERHVAFGSLVDLLDLINDDPAYLRKAGDYLFQMKEWTFSREVRQRRLKLMPDDPGAMMDIVECEVALQSPDVFKSLQKIQAVNGLTANDWFRICYIYGELGDRRPMMEAGARAIALGYEEWRVRHRLAFCLAGLELAPSARTEIRHIVITDRIPTHQLAALYHLAVRIDDWQSARNIATGWYARAPDAAATLSLCEAWSQRGKGLPPRDLCAEVAQKLTASPNLPAQTFERAVVLLRRHGYLDEALAVLQRAAAQFPGHETFLVWLAEWEAGSGAPVAERRPGWFARLRRA